MPVLVTGMHRSGTSLVAQLLQACGLDLGPEEELIPADSWNANGYYENRSLVTLADDLLEELGGGWDLPPERPADGLAARGPERLAATAQALGAAEPWGWKDPRAALLLPECLRAFPGLRVVVCVRHPLEVAVSLRHRGAMSPALALRLWMRTYEEILRVLPPEQRVVTAYDAYFVDPAAELERLLRGTGLDAPAATRAEAVALVAPAQRHTTPVPVDALPAPARDLYLELLAEAGAVPEALASVPLQPRAGRAPVGAAVDALLEQEGLRDQLAHTAKDRDNWQAAAGRSEAAAQRLQAEVVRLGVVEQEARATAAALAAAQAEVQRLRQERDAHADDAALLRAQAEARPGARLRRALRRAPGEPDDRQT